MADQAESTQSDEGLKAYVKGRLRKGKGSRNPSKDGRPPAGRKRPLSAFPRQDDFVNWGAGQD